MMTSPPSLLMRSRGFTLIEIGIGLLVLGVITVSIMQIQKIAEARRATLETENRMGRAVQALADYVEVANRLPCPADPAADDATFGHERGVTVSMLTINDPRPMGRCGTTDFEGILPFQTLGLTYDQILDGWGRPLTYAVSPVFAQDNDLSDDNFDLDGDGDLTEPQNRLTPGVNDEDEVIVHPRCRTPAWIITGDNVNTPKAFFCCAGSGQSATSYGKGDDLQIEVPVPAGYVISPVRQDQDDATSDYGRADTLYRQIAWPYGPRPAETSVTAPAFVLISHGPNGLGSYLANNTSQRYRTAFLGGQEQMNADFSPSAPAQNRTYVTAQRSGDFDDIVTWMTQDGIMAYNGASSCVYP
ncbi:MAG: type II secretion system protein [Pseudomonadota bacterium]